MSLFVAAVDGGSLAAAAKRYGRSPASVTRAVVLLELNAGETLLLRSTRKLSLTASGERHVAVWRDVLAKLGELAPIEADAPIQGNIVLTAPELFGRIAVMPLVETFLVKHPLVSARALLVNRLVNLIGEGVDLAVRLAPLADSSLSAIRIGEVRTLLCASPTYLNGSPSLTTPADLERHACIGLDVEAEGERWAFASPESSSRKRRSVRVRPRLSTNNAAAAIDASVRGHGLIQARSYQVASAIAEGRLKRLLPEWEEPPAPAQLLFPAERAGKGSMRALIDHLGPALKRILVGVEASIGIATTRP
ncbi:LysR family transcriptional regulator [Sphingomonas sp. STIS6.2]|uniref:LysR family transcriptional regulator n=1 Tax=Sphingomonas sp. STIS6.2 TaxID=1379700 RepID=UPI001F38D17C|nr:LysR family transcriptional regulator [Sphingomonas sp. STIS6.2]